MTFSIPLRVFCVGLAFAQSAAVGPNPAPIMPLNMSLANAIITAIPTHPTPAASTPFATATTTVPPNVSISISVTSTSRTPAASSTASPTVIVNTPAADTASGPVATNATNASNASNATAATTATTNATTDAASDDTNNTELFADSDSGCGLVCMMFCKNGNVVDDDGCPLCECIRDGGSGGNNTNTNIAEPSAATNGTSINGSAVAPAWTRDGDVEAPAGARDMGGWTAAVYTAEQQSRLGVDEWGETAAGDSTAAAAAAATTTNVTTNVTTTNVTTTNGTGTNATISSTTSTTSNITANSTAIADVSSTNATASTASTTSTTSTTSTSLAPDVYVVITYDGAPDDYAAMPSPDGAGDVGYRSGGTALPEELGFEHPDRFLATCYCYNGTAFVAPVQTIAASGWWRHAERLSCPDDTEPICEARLDVIHATMAAFALIVGCCAVGAVLVSQRFCCRRRCASGMGWHRQPYDVRQMQPLIVVNEASEHAYPSDHPPSGKLANGSLLELWEFEAPRPPQYKSEQSRV